jgi:glutamate dehydrogenase
MSLRLIVAGSGALYDPAGIDPEELGRLLLRANVDEFRPEKLHPGGFLLSRKATRQEGLRELFRKIVATEAGIEEHWVTSDEFHREFDGLIFSVPADLFLPAGGRPETIDGRNWQRLFGEDGTATCRAVVEGANSYLTPEARVELQKRGVVVIRDASANKCGVISSSYEIIANLLMSDEEFLARKEEYVADVLRILEERARGEARLLFARHREAQGRLLFTEISDSLSSEINGHYSRLFDLFTGRPDLAKKPLFRQVLLAHLPAMVRSDPKLRRRIAALPFKHQCAMMASEIATRIVYRGGWGEDLEESVQRYVRAQFP